MEVGLRPSVRLGSPRKLFARQRSGAPAVASGGPEGFDVTPDGTRFVAIGGSPGAFAPGAWTELGADPPNPPAE